MDSGAKKKTREKSIGHRVRIHLGERSGEVGPMCVGKDSNPVYYEDCTAIYVFFFSVFH